MADPLDKLARKVAGALARETAPKLTSQEVQELVQELGTDPDAEWTEDAQVARESARGALAATFAVIRAAGHVENLVADFSKRHAASPVLASLGKLPGADAAAIVQAIQRMLVGLAHNLERTMPPEVRKEVSRSQDLAATIQLAVNGDEFCWSCGSLQGARIPLTPLVKDSVVRHAGIPEPEASAMAELIAADLRSASVSVPHFTRTRSGEMVFLQWVPPTVVVTADDLQKADEEFASLGQSEEIGVPETLQAAPGITIGEAIEFEIAAEQVAGLGVLKQIPFNVQVNKIAAAAATAKLETKISPSPAKAGIPPRGPKDIDINGPQF